MRATRAQIAGDPDEAEQLATEALQIGTDGGEPDADRHLRRTAHDREPPTRHPGRTGSPHRSRRQPTIPGSRRFTAALALAHAKADRIDEARQLLEEFAAADFDLPLDAVWLTGMVYYAEAAIECRDPKYAGPLFDRLAPWADQLVYDLGPTVQGPVSHYLGGLATVLGRYDEADAYFAQSAASSERLDAKFFAARTDLLWGRMLAERRGPGRHPRRPGTFSPRRTPPRRPMGTGTSNDALRQHSNSQTP